MNNTEIKTVELVINSQQANKKLDEINAKLEKARQKKMEAFEKGDSAGMQVYGKEIAKLEREQHRLETRAKSITRVLQHIDKATPNELKKTIREINKELNSGAVERGSKEWNTLTHSLREANRQLKEIKEETNASRSLSDRFADWGNKWVGISSTIYTGVQTLTGIKTTAMEAVNAFAEMEEAESQAVKYTGLGKEAVKELNEEFKRLDTRTPREKLNELAGDAGRLGVTTKEAVMEFVEGGNMINVALGEDLGEDAVKNIGKIVQFFGNDKVQGWKQAMLSTGSVVNTLGQTSSANEGYIVDFTYRLAGMGHQAGLAQTQIMGYASVLDQAMVNSEEGSTALSKIIQKMFREPEKLAKAAGLNVQEFTKLVKTDANEALLEFATATERMGGLERIAPMLGDLSLTGAGVSKTLSALAKDVNKVRETQQLAAQSFAEGTSIVNEYNVANNTVQANLEKARNAANDLRVELGEQLQPIIAEGIHLGTATMKLATEILKFASENRAAIISTTVAIAGYTVKVNASIIADKAKVLWTNRVKVAVSGLWKTLRANPWGVVIAAAGLAIGALIDYQRQQDKTTAKMRAEANIRKKAGEQYQSEADRIKTLREQIENNNLSLEFRRKRLEELKSIVPGYLADLTDEGTLVNNNTTALDDYLKKLEKEIRLKAVREELEELVKEETISIPVLTVTGVAIENRAQRGNSTGGFSLQEYIEDDSLENEESEVPDFIEVAYNDDTEHYGLSDSGIKCKYWFGKTFCGVMGNVRVNTLSFDFGLVPTDGANIYSLCHSGLLQIDKTAKHCIRFLHPGSVDPKQLFVIRGKRFVCEKIERQIDSKGMQPLVTGYFYEVSE